MNNDVMLKRNHGDQPHCQKAGDVRQEDDGPTDAVTVDNGHLHHVQPDQEYGQQVNARRPRQRCQVKVGRVQTQVFRGENTGC